MLYYPRPVQWLHWIMAIALVGMVVFGLIMGSLPLSDERRDLFMLGHLATGVLLLMAAGLRLRWRIEGRMPALPEVYRPWERAIARTVHAAFYVLMFGLPLLGLSVWLLDPFVWGPGLAGQSIALANLTGWLHWGHYLGAWLLIGLLIVHVIGALRGLASKNPQRQVLRRMTGDSKPE
jgi:cytochrome b561